MAGPSLPQTRSEQDYRSLELMFAAVLAVVDAGLVIFDDQGRFVIASPSFLDRFRWRGNTIHKETFASLFPDSELPRSRVQVPRSVSAGRYTTRVRAGDRALIETEVHARFVTEIGRAH